MRCKSAPPTGRNTWRGCNGRNAGLLITLGPTEGSTHVFGIYEADSQAQVEELLHNDVYWRNGIWTELTVYPWIQAF
jgi:uncharacterized protein YciI